MHLLPTPLQLTRLHRLQGRLLLRPSLLMWRSCELPMPPLHCERWVTSCLRMQTAAARFTSRLLRAALLR